MQYDSIARLLVLPKSHTPHTLVIISLDPPIRKGQTYYAHLLCQFNNDEDVNISLEISDEQLAAKNVTVRSSQGHCQACNRRKQLLASSIAETPVRPWGQATVLLACLT